MVNQERVKSLLGTGISVQVVASAVGCDPSYISQLLSDENFALEVATLRAGDVIKYVDIDAKYDEIEKKLLEKLENTIPYFTKPRDILAALMAVNGAKRKSAGAPKDDPTKQNVVSLNLPNIIVNNYKVNIHGAMVEVGGRSLTPMPSSILMKTLEDRRENEKLARLPEKVAEPIVPNERIAHESKI